jgi:GNAT superfamily N-acetyltransferase
MFTDATLAEHAAAGLYAHWIAQCGYVKGGEIAERHGLLVTATRLPDPTLNVAFAPSDVAAPESALDWVEEWFRTRGLHPGVEVRVGRVPTLERLLADRRYTVVVRRPAMALHPIVLADATPPRCTVRAVESDTDLRAFQDIQAEVFDIAPDVVTEFLPRAAVETAGICFLLAFHDDVACATAATSVSAHGAGIVGVATLPAYRRRGLGRAVTTAAARWGAEQGADLAWLYPSAMARPLYEGLGFRAVDETQVWVSP